MLFLKILKFYGLIVTALWLDMLTYLLCIFCISVMNVFGSVYLNDATQDRLNHVRQTGIPYLEKEIEQLSIPDVNGETNTPIGSVSFGISSVTLKDVSIPKSNVAFHEKTGFGLSCSDAGLQIHTKWKYKEKSWPHVKDSGTMTVYISGIHLEISFRAVDENEQKPQVISRKCALKIGDLRLKFHGGASWLYNLFANRIASDLKKILVKEICQRISEAINEKGDLLLQELPETVKTIKTRIASFEKTKI